jgi:3-dehydroquinate synthase
VKTNEITIKSGQGDYSVKFLREIKEINLALKKYEEDYFLICDDKVWKIYEKYFKAIPTKSKIVLKADEELKTVNGVNKVLEWLSINGATKTSQILAIGGGVIQDIATFVSHIYYRGIKWHFIPTTLLSQADSSIGAKCGINLLSHKNQLGVIHSPSSILIVEEFLSSLDLEEFQGGFGEIYKLSVTGPGQFYEMLKDKLLKIGITPSNSLELVQASLLAKKYIIEEDEYEKDLRRILNYGHSFGHALESLTDNTVTHGFGVFFGMDLINFLGTKWGTTKVSFYKEFKSLIVDNFSSYMIHNEITASGLLSEVTKDKKVQNGVMNFAVLYSPGDIRIVEKKLDKQLENYVEEYLANEAIFRAS